MDAKEFLGGIDRSLVHWHPTIDESKCNKCLTCVNFCSHGVYRVMGDQPKVVNITECVLFCNNCQPKCPTGAISFPTTTALYKEVRDIRRKMQVK